MAIRMQSVTRELIVKLLEITRTKNYIKKSYNLLWHKYVSVLKSYGKQELASALKSLDIGPGDTVLMHSSFSAFSGFKGIPQDVINVCLDIIGQDGNLLMVSLPYTGATLHYLQDRKVFNVKRTPSKMGIISEVFRRKEGVVRSLHPTHPVLAYGKDKIWLTEGHENAIYTCGEGTPFEKLLKINGKVLFYGVTFRTCTFMHYVEDRIKEKLPFDLYTSQSVPVDVIDCDGNERLLNIFPYSEAAFMTRKTFMVEEYLIKDRKIFNAVVGNTEIYTALAADIFSTAVGMIDNGNYFYDIDMAMNKYVPDAELNRV